MSKIFADISHWQGSINWDKYPYDTVIMKCTQGVSYVDPTFATNRIKATAKGIKCGYYHFADNNDPIKEAKHFLNTVGVLVCGEFVALDSETGQTADWCKKWLEYVEEKVGFKPLLYAPVSGWKVSLNYPLWVARYGINNGSVDYNNPPKIGKWKEYKIWQYTSKGFVNGISGNVDMNIYENIDDIGKQSTQEIDPETSENPQPTSDTTLPTETPIEPPVNAQSTTVSTQPSLISKFLIKWIQNLKNALTHWLGGSE